VDVGLSLAYITPGYWFRIEGRSGLGFKNSIQPHLGVIDNGYRGDLAVKLYNFHETKDLNVQPGDRIAQIVVYPLIQPEFKFADDVSESTRGDKGFGSSDNITRPPFAGMNMLKETPADHIITETTTENSTTYSNQVKDV
jgi:dUTP pyrophosphatase